jgi:predicted RNase H-like nuclease (RuvC/YqgF family)
MKTYNYEARSEDKQNNYLEPHPDDPKYYKQNNYPKPHPEEVKIIPVFEQLSELEYAIEKLSALQETLIKRLEWVSNPCNAGPVSELCSNSKKEDQESEIVRRIRNSVQNIKNLQYRLSNQLETLEV